MSYILEVIHTNLFTAFISCFFFLLIKTNKLPLFVPIMEAQGVFTLITFVVLELVTLRHNVLNAKIVNFITCVN
jgi:hypothetical protein